MVNLLCKSNTTGRAQRLAVMTFISTQNNEAKNEFGEYITESTISTLNNKKDIFKLFERKRLDLIFKENALVVSGLLDETQAKKLGELLPIDLILSGSYTKLKNYIDINARLIDVVTGEILVTFSGRIAMTSDLATLFSNETNQQQQTQQQNNEPCKETKLASEKVKKLLNDLTSSEKIQTIVDEAIKIPFDMECGLVHFSIMPTFKRNNIENLTYKNFLMKTLGTVEYPGNDDRAYDIFQYLAKDSIIDNEEWKVSLAALQKIGNYRLRNCLGIFLSTKNEEKIIKQRIDEYFTLAKANKIGLPTPIDFTKAFFAMVQGMYKVDNKYGIYCYEQYAPLVVLDKTTYKDFYFYLKKMYEEEANPSNKKMVVEWISDFFDKAEATEKNAEYLYDFANEFKLYEEHEPYAKEKNKKIMQNFPEKDLQYFIGLSKKKFAEYAVLTLYSSQRDDRIDFCLRYGIPISGIIPTMEEAKEILDGNDWKEKMRVMKLLEKMGAQTKPLEKTFLKILDARNIEHKNELKTVQESALLLLGSLKNSSPKVIAPMINSLSGYEAILPEKAIEALVNIGKPAVPALLKKLQSLIRYHYKTGEAIADDGATTYRIISILGRIGKDALESKKFLQQLVDKNLNNNSDTKYILEAAIQSME